MFLYCSINNLGYGELIDVESRDNDYIISLKFKNEVVKRFLISLAYDKKSIFLDEQMQDYSFEELKKIIEDEITSGKFDEFIKERLLTKYKEDAEKLHMLLEVKYNFKGFMHETTINNVVSILHDGRLKARNELESFDDSANVEVMDHTKSEVKKQVRFYFYPGTPTNYRFEQKNPNEMVYLVFDWDLVFANKAQFVNGNASSIHSDSMFVSDYINNPNDFMDWDSIFHRESLPTLEECIMAVGFNYKNEIIRKRNAEINIPSGVSLKYLNKIVFKNQNAYDKFTKELNDEIMLLDISDKIVIDDSYFF